MYFSFRTISQSSSSQIPFIFRLKIPYSLSLGSHWNACASCYPHKTPSSAQFCWENVYGGREMKQSRLALCKLLCFPGGPCAGSSGIKNTHHLRGSEAHCRPCSLHFEFVREKCSMKTKPCYHECWAKMSRTCVWGNVSHSDRLIPLQSVSILPWRLNLHSQEVRA